MTAWLGVVSADHVRRGISLGIAQIGHGKSSGLAKMHRGDWLVYYSPRVSLEGTEPLRAFTALGQIPDDEIWQAQDGDFRPFRRRVEYDHTAREIPIAELMGSLDLTAGSNWGYQLRRGLIPLSERDFTTIRESMTSPE